MILETERLILRPMDWADYPVLHEFLSDDENMKHYPQHFTDEMVADWIRRNLERYRVFGFGLWSVVLKETGEMIGDCGLTMQVINGKIRPEIGFHITPVHQRRGCAREAAAGCVKWAFENTPFNTLYSYTTADNLPSIRTAWAIGMEPDETFMDPVSGPMTVSALTRHEWERAAAKNRPDRRS